MTLVAILEEILSIGLAAAPWLLLGLVMAGADQGVRAGGDAAPLDRR